MLVDPVKVTNTFFLLKRTLSLYLTVKVEGPRLQRVVGAYFRGVLEALLIHTGATTCLWI